MPKLTKQYPNSNYEKPYELNERLLLFAKDCRKFVASLPKQTSSYEDGKQLIRSSGSVGANYIEASEAFSKKDFIFRIRIAKKEAHESYWWLRVIESNDPGIERLKQEAYELTKILGSILAKSNASKIRT